MDTKKKVTYAVIAIVAAFFGWQMMGMFGGEEVDAGPKMQPNPDIPKASTLVPQQAKTPQMTEREMQLIKLQQDTQTKYLSAINELQMLKIEKDIAETSRDVSKAKLEGITAQKGIVELLTPPKPEATPATYAQGLDHSAAQGTGTETTTTTTTTAASPVATSDPYTVISVSRIRGQWTAVLGFSGALYSVKNGDVLPGDGSVVIGIQRDGVLLEKNGTRRMISMVPII